LLKRVELLILIYVLLTTSMNASLFILGENRIDAYVAVNVLSYFITYAVVRPFLETPLYVKVLNVALLLSFMIIVALRVYEVLVG